MFAFIKRNKSDAKNFASCFSIIKQLMPVLAVNIIIDHPWDVVFPQAKALGKTTPSGEQL
jgi:hypothetical protein